MKCGYCGIELDPPMIRTISGVIFRRYCHVCEAMLNTLSVRAYWVRVEVEARRQSQGMNDY